MPRMLDMIRDSQVPSTLMQSAARGALATSSGETIEILVYLAVHHKLFGEQARLTLAGWDEKASIAAASDPKTSAEVLAYCVAAENLRPVLLPALAENPSIAEEPLDLLAASGSRSVIEVLLASPRVAHSHRLLQTLRLNVDLRPGEVAEVQEKLSALARMPVAEVEAADEVVEGEVKKYLQENAAELEAEKDKPYQPIGVAQEDGADSNPLEEVQPEAVAAASVAAVEIEKTESASDEKKPENVAAAKLAAAAAAAKKKMQSSIAEKRDSTLQKISKLDIRGRITLAMRGNKEDRSILIRDSTKLVAIAVLESPKITDGEVEKFALQKNVLEAVLRAIPMKRRFAKNYVIVKHLVQNPRTPLDLSLGLMKNLLIHDLKNLSGNKEVSDTIRKVALRMFRQKLEKKG